jgi:phage shock protein C
MSRRLYRSSTNKVIAGICGGLGEHLDVDPTLMRLIVVVGALASFGAVVIFYLIAWIILPLPAPGEDVSDPVAGSDPFVPKTRSGWRVYLPGVILVVIGVMFLLPAYLPWFEWQDLWPLLLVLLGAMLILRSGRASRTSDIPPVDGPGSQRRDGGMNP